MVQEQLQVYEALHRKIVRLMKLKGRKHRRCRSAPDCSKASITVVLAKEGKSDYATPKSWRPHGAALQLSTRSSSGSLQTFFGE